MLGLIRILKFSVFASTVLLRLNLATAQQEIFHSKTNNPRSQAQGILDNPAKGFELCREKIHELLCIVDPPQKDANGTEELANTRTCLSGGEQYASFFESHFDRSPVYIQKMYCHLTKIYIENEFIATAYASNDIDSSGKVIGGIIGIRRELLDIDISFDQWLNWKEETSFGGPVPMNSKSIDLIHYKSNLDSKSFLIDYVVNHEFGHLFDFSNNLTSFDDCRYVETEPGKWERKGACSVRPGSFSEFSWKDIDHRNDLARFPYENDICFYFCNGKFLPLQAAIEIFSGITQTNFISIYASRFASEDWAETFAQLVAHKELGLNLSVESQGQAFNLSEHWRSEVMRPKNEFVEKFLNSKFKYPGEELKSTSRLTID